MRIGRFSVIRVLDPYVTKCERAVGGAFNLATEVRFMGLVEEQRAQKNNRMVMTCRAVQSLLA